MVPYSHNDQLFIGGAWVGPQGERGFEVLNCATEERLVRVAGAGEDDVRRAVAAAHEAFHDGVWPRLTPEDRAAYLTAIGRKLLDRSEELADIWSLESGIVRGLAGTITPAVGQFFLDTALLAKSFPFEELHQPGAGGEYGLLVREPVGVVAAIIPWNAPALLMAYKVAPALLAGCTVILKASPEAPGSCYILAEVIEEVGLPAGVFNFITADRSESEALVRDPVVDKVSFTGSTAAGRRIAALMGERIGRYSLELGGKSAALILDDYDIETAATDLAGSSAFLTGQACSSLTRIIVREDRRDAMVEALAAQFAKIAIGDPFDAGTGMGPLAMARQRDRIEQLLAQAREQGAVVACGGGRPAHLNRGFFIEPTVLTNVDNASMIAQTEIFGPVLCVIAARDDDHAIALAEDTIYGLNNSIYTNDVDKALRYSRKLRSGTVGHNACRTDFTIAAGGFKQSGIGREGGREGLYPFLETKTIILNGIPARAASADTL